MIDSIEALEAIYGLPHERAVRKQIPFLNEDYQAMVRVSPLVIVSSVGADGLDNSPRGDAPGFVQIIDQHTLALPDRPGNNRIDTLRNVLHDPRVSLLFIIPGIGETLRVNGTASISAEPALLESFAVNGKAAKTVLLVTGSGVLSLLESLRPLRRVEPANPPDALGFALRRRLPQTPERWPVRRRQLRPRSAKTNA